MVLESSWASRGRRQTRRQPAVVVAGHIRDHILGIDPALEEVEHPEDNFDRFVGVVADTGLGYLLCGCLGSATDVWEKDGTNQEGNCRRVAAEAAAADQDRSNQRWTLWVEEQGFTRTSEEEHSAGAGKTPTTFYVQGRLSWAPWRPEFIGSRRGFMRLDGVVWPPRTQEVFHRTPIWYTNSTWQ